MKSKIEKIFENFEEKHKRRHIISYGKKFDYLESQITEKEWNQLKAEILKIVEEFEEENKDWELQLNVTKKQLYDEIDNLKKLEKQLKEKDKVFCIFNFEDGRKLSFETRKLFEEMFVSKQDIKELENRYEDCVTAENCMTLIKKERQKIKQLKQDNVKLKMQVNLLKGKIGDK